MRIAMSKVTKTYSKGTDPPCIVERVDLKIDTGEVFNCWPMRMLCLVFGSAAFIVLLVAIHMNFPT